MKIDTLKQRINRRERVLGVGGIPARTSRERLEALAASGPYDFVFVDSQHAPFEENDLVALCDAAAELSLSVMFRLQHTRQAFLAGNMLDLGPTGIEVPQVESPATATEALESFYYPPRGRRSIGGAVRLGLAEFPNPDDYAAWWNQFGVLWLQVESVRAVIGAYSLAMDGVDCLSFGPADLGMDLQHNPHPKLSSVDDCVRYVCRALEGTGTAVCFRNGTPDTREKYADMGVTVFLEKPTV
jgi:2-keto-3-deoxy-L-rhamnonate aldolase RhmA